MDTAVSVLQSIYDVYKTIKDGQEQFAATYERMDNLLGQLRSMEASDTLVQNQFLDKYLVLARGFLAYLEKYKKRKFLSKVFHQSEMLEEVDGFNQQLEALFQHFHLAMGSHIVEHNRTQEASIDELVRGMRVLLQGANTGHSLKTGVSSDDLLGGADVVQSSGPVSTALKGGDAVALVGFLVESNDDKLVEDAVVAVCQLAEQDMTRDAIVEAGAIPRLISMISSSRSRAESTVRVHAARAIRRLAVRDVYEVAIVEAGAIEKLALLVDVSPANTAAETSAACAALANLTFQPQHKIVMLETPHLIAHLVELVRGGSAPQKKHAINVLRELSSNDDCASVIRKAQGITVLVDVLHIGTPEQCAVALAVLWNMAAHEANRTEIAAVGGINAIVSQIRRSTSDDQKQLAASTLAVLAQDDSNDSLVGATDGVVLLVKLLQTGTEGQKNSASWALAELANDAENAEAMMAADVAPALMAACRSGTDIQRSKAGLALVWIAQLTEDKAALVNEIGLSSIVSMLRGSVDQKQNAAGIIEGIAEDEEIQQQLGQLGAIEQLVDLVKSHSPKIAAVKALQALVVDHDDGDNENAELVSNARGVEVLVEVLEKLMESDTTSTDETFEAVLDLLATISEKASKVLQKVIDANGLPLLLETLDTGSLERKRRVAVLLNEFASDLPNDESLAACTKALVKVARPVDGEELDDELTNTALDALWSIASGPVGKFILVEQESGIELLVSLLRSSISEDNKKTAGYALGNLAGDETLAKRIVDEGALSIYESLLNTKSAELQFAAMYGLTTMSAHAEVASTIGKIPALCKRIIKLLAVGVDDEVTTRATWTLHHLTAHKEIAAELGPMHGLEELVTLVQDHADADASEYHGINQSYHSACALRNLACVPENADILTEICAVGAAVTLLQVEDRDERSQTAALEMLELVSTNREAGEAMIASGDVVAQCVERLQLETENWSELSLNILTNLNELQMTEDPDADSDNDGSEDGEEEEDQVDGDDDEEEEGGEESDGDEDEEEAERSFLEQILDADGLVPLMEILEEREVGKRTGLIKLLNALAQETDAAKITIGGSVSFLVDVMREAAEDEQLATAAAVVTLIDGSKRNAGAAIRARVDEAIVQLLATVIENVEVAEETTEELIAKLTALKSADAKAAVSKTAKALATAAVSIPTESSKSAFKVLDKLLLSAGSVKTFVEAGAVAVSCEALKANASTETVMRAVTLLSKVSRTKYRTKLVEQGVVDLLRTLEKASPLEPPLQEVVKEALASLETAAF